MSRLLLLLALLALSSPGYSAEPTVDAGIKAQLDALKLTYTVDADGDFQVTFEVENKRTQLVFVRSVTEKYGTHSVREIWSPGYRFKSGQLSQEVANRLLQHSGTMILGGWTLQKEMAMFVVKIPTSAISDQLRDAMEAAALGADTIEAEFTPGKDEL